MDYINRFPCLVVSRRVWSGGGDAGRRCKGGSPESKVSVLVPRVPPVPGRRHSCLMVLSKEFSLGLLNHFPPSSFQALPMFVISPRIPRHPLLLFLNSAHAFFRRRPSRKSSP